MRSTGQQAQLCPVPDVAKWFQAAFVGEAKGLSAHYAASVLSGSTLSHCRHRRSVLPSAVATAIMRLEQRGHRVGSMKTAFFSQNGNMEQKFPLEIGVSLMEEGAVQAAIDRVMKTYGMLVNLTPQQEQAAREKVSSFLANAHTADENKLAIEGLRYLRTSFREHNRQDF